jgi:sugar lactone lactonase YvrE
MLESLKYYGGLSAAVVHLVLLLGCSPGSESSDRLPTSTRGPSVAALDSTVLEEPDSLALGRLSFLARDAQRHMYVSDYENGRVLRYAPDGRTLSVIGKKGRGPGELETASTLILLERDTILAVFDGSSRRISLFDARSSAYVRSVKVPITLMGQAWSWKGDTAFFAIHGSPWFLARWSLDGDSVALFSAVPSRLLSAGLFYIMYGRPEAIRRDSEFIVQIPTEPGVQIFNLEGVPVGQVALPASRRLGTPPNVVEDHKRLQRSGQRFQFLASAPYGMQVLSSGHIAVLQVDVEVLRPPPNPEFGNFRLFVSLLSPDLSQACVDAELPFKTDATPAPIFVGDTLFALSRLVTEENRVRNVIHAFRVSSEGCEWVPTGGRQPARPQ